MKSASELTNRIFQISSGLDLPRGEPEQFVVPVFLFQANERLHSVEMLLGKDDIESAVIITRSLFELAVNLAYIAKDLKKRMPQYLTHAHIPTTQEEAQQLLQELENGTWVFIPPKQAWKRLKDMCCDLGSDWLKEYETFYRHASVPTHAGANTLVGNLKRLLYEEPPSDWEKSRTLLTASAFHLRLLEIASKTFPGEIDSESVLQLRQECNQLGQALKMN